MINEAYLNQIALSLKTKLKEAKSVKFIKRGIEVKLDSINSLPKAKRILISQGFTYKAKMDTLVYLYSKKNVELILRVDTSILKLKTMKPNYDLSMLSLTQSILKHYSKDTKYQSVKKLDDFLLKNDKDHIVFIILDGLGENILKRLDKKSFLRKNHFMKLSACYPSTTAVQIPISQSALPPIKTGWIGWANYFSDLDKTLVMFTGKNYFNDEPTGINIRKSYLPYDTYYESLGVPYLEVMPSFSQNGVKSFEEGIKKVLKFQKENKKSFTYFYWDEPDGTLHEYGTMSNEVMSEILKINQVFEKYQNDFSNTTLLLTSDHGHQDVISIDFNLFTDLTSMLERRPSNEGRATVFKVKNGFKEKFKNLFISYFDGLFILKTKKEFIDEGYLGKNEGAISKRLFSFLGDFIALAISNFTFTFKDHPILMKSTHAGLTKNEMEVPLIVYQK